MSSLKISPLICSIVQFTHSHDQRYPIFHLKDHMEILIDILVVILSIVIITQGAVWLVDSAIRIAKKLGVSELVIGLTIVAFGTSAPEFGVTILAALRDMGDISVGNIVGSNIFNLGFILGGTAVIRSLSTDRTVIIRDGGFLLVGTLILMVFLWDLKFEFMEGTVFWSCCLPT